MYIFFNHPHCDFQDSRVPQIFHVWCHFLLFMDTLQSPLASCLFYPLIFAFPSHPNSFESLSASFFPSLPTSQHSCGWQQSCGYWLWSKEQNILIPKLPLHTQTALQRKVILDLINKKQIQLLMGSLWELSRHIFWIMCSSRESTEILKNFVQQNNNNRDTVQ